MIASPFRDGTIARSAGAAGHRHVHAGRHCRLARTRACSAAPCRSSTPTCAPAAWNARWSARTPRFRTPCTTSTNCCSTGDPAARHRRSPAGSDARPAFRRWPKRCARRTAQSKEPRRSTKSSPQAASTLEANSHADAQFRQARRGPVGLSGRQDAAVLRCHGEEPSPVAAACIRVNVDPWKCTGCLECVDVCGPGALVDARAGRRRCWRTCRPASSS